MPPTPRPTTSTCSAPSASTPGEALLLELDPPDTRYWSVTLENIWHECIDPRRRRSSLTNAAAVADADGTVRSSIAADRPRRAPNWLDTGGRHRGFVIVRWLDNPDGARRSPPGSCRSPRSPASWGHRADGPDPFDRDRLVAEAPARGHRPRRLRRGDTWQEGLDVLLDRCSTRHGLTRAGRGHRRGRDHRLPRQPARHHRLAARPPGGGRGRHRPTDRDRRPAPHRHHDPLRPAGPGPGPAGPAHLGGRPAACRRPRPRRTTPTRASTRCRPPSTWPTSLIPGFTSFHPMGARLGPGVRADHGRRLPQHDLPHAVPAARPTTAGCSTRPTSRPAYRWHRQFLQHLQSRHPADRWLLKSPAHLWHLGALAAEYPDAVVVQTHRDPLRSYRVGQRPGRPPAADGE